MLSLLINTIYYTQFILEGSILGMFSALKTYMFSPSFQRTKELFSLGYGEQVFSFYLNI